MKARTLVLIGLVLFASIIALLVFVNALQLPKAKVAERTGRTISGVTIVRPGQGHLENHSLTFDQGLIQEIAPTDASEVSDLEHLSGAYALPGLVDMHVHHMPDIARLTQLWDLLFIAHGVTTVRDLGVTSAQDSVPMARLSEQIAKGEAIGPRIFYCGPTLDADPPSIAHFRTVRNEDEARDIVAELAKDGCSCVKTYNLLSADLFRALHEQAEAKGLRHVAHLPYSIELADAGGVELQHYAGLGAAQTVRSFSDQWMGWPEIDDDDLAEIVATSFEHNISHTPTISMWANMSMMFDSAAKESRYTRLLPRLYRDAIWTAEKGEPQLRTLTLEDVETLAQAIPKMRRLTRMLHENGVSVFIGTDPVMPHSVPGYAMHQELRQFVEAGFTPEQVWEIATSKAGEALGDAKVGRLEVGAYADILFFKEDPTKDLDHLDSLLGVVADGRYYSRSTLDELVAQQQNHFNGALFDTISMKLADLYF